MTCLSSPYVTVYMLVLYIWVLTCEWCLCGKLIKCDSSLSMKSEGSMMEDVQIALLWVHLPFSNKWDTCLFQRDKKEEGILVFRTQTECNLKGIIIRAGEAAGEAPGHLHICLNPSLQVKRTHFNDKVLAAILNWLTYKSTHMCFCFNVKREFNWFDFNSLQTLVFMQWNESIDEV